MAAEVGIQFPPGVKDLSGDMSPPELLKSLKRCCKFFSCLEQNQEEEKLTYRPFCDYIGTNTFLNELTDKNVKILVGCLISDVLRVYAPEHPFKSTDVIKLMHLQDPKHSLYARAYHILDNMISVQSFHMLNDIDSGNHSKEVYPKLFRSMITTSNPKHDNRLKEKILSMLSSILSYATFISQEFLDSIWEHLLDPIPSLHPAAYETTKAIIRRSSDALEGPTTAFFHAIFFQDDPSKGRTRVMDHWADIYYELYNISPLLLKECVSYFDIKLRTDDKEERLGVTRLLARMFSDKNLQYASENKALWKAFLGRFNDINQEVRVACVSFCADMILNHSGSEFVDDLLPLIKSRRHDLDDNVRHAVVVMIHQVALKNIELISDEILDFFTERCRDKKRKVRECAISAVAEIYKKYTVGDKVKKNIMARVDNFKNVLLHAYYSQNIDECLAIERMMVSTLVPYTLPPDERVKRLLDLYVTADDKAMRAINEMMQRQKTYIITPLKYIVDTLANNKEENMPMLWKQVTLLSQQLPNQQHASTNLKHFVRVADKDNRLLQWLKTITDEESSSQKVAVAVRDLLKHLESNSEARSMKLSVRHLLERAAMFFILVDKNSFQTLIKYVSDIVNQTNNVELTAETHMKNSLMFIKRCVLFSPSLITTHESLSTLVSFLSDSNETVVLDALHVIKLVARVIEKEFSDIKSVLVPELSAKAKDIMVKEAKYSVQCLAEMESVKEEELMKIFNHCLQVAKTSTVRSENIRSALSVIGSIAKVLPGQTCNKVKEFVSNTIVKQILQKTVTPPLSATKKKKQLKWAEKSELFAETLTKIECLKCIARWVEGSTGNYTVSSLRLLQHVLANNGDLMNTDRIPLVDMAHLRLCAAICVLKIAQVSRNINYILPVMFEELALLVNDEVLGVRQTFITKLFQKLYSFALPPIFLSLFGMVAQEKSKEHRLRWTHYYAQLIRRYRESNTITSSTTHIPEVCIPYLIHILSSDPDLRNHGINKDGLARARGCLQFMLEPILLKSCPESFGFIKRMTELLKQTRMVEYKEDANKNEVMFAICDLTMQFVLQRSAQHAVAVIEPSDKSLSRLIPDTHFTKISHNENEKNYLPEEFRIIARPVPAPLAADGKTRKARRDVVGPLSYQESKSKMQAKLCITGGKVRRKTKSHLSRKVVAVSKVAVVTPVQRKPAKSDSSKSIESETPASISSVDSGSFNSNISSTDKSTPQLSTWLKSARPKPTSPGVCDQPNSRLPPRKRKLNLEASSFTSPISSQEEDSDDESLSQIKKRMNNSSSINSQSDVESSPVRPRRSNAGRNRKYNDGDFVSESPSKKKANLLTLRNNTAQNSKKAAKKEVKAEKKKTIKNVITETESSNTESSQSSVATRRSVRQRKKKSATK